MDPYLQDEVRDEISVAGDPSFDDLNNKYPLLDALVKETLRLHPAILENHHVVSFMPHFFLCKVLYNLIYY